MRNALLQCLSTQMLLPKVFRQLNLEDKKKYIVRLCDLRVYDRRGVPGAPGRGFSTNDAAYTVRIIKSMEKLEGLILDELASIKLACKDAGWKPDYHLLRKCEWEDKGLRAVWTRYRQCT